MCKILPLSIPNLANLEEQFIVKISIVNMYNKFYKFKLSFDNLCAQRTIALKHFGHSHAVGTYCVSDQIILVWSA